MAEKTTIENLQAELARMKSLMERAGVLPREASRTAQPDYVEWGSDRHAAIIGLKKATPDDKIEFDGWALQDTTQFGPQARDEYIREVLRQKVSTLKAGAPTVDPNAPPLWRPAPEDQYIP